MAAEQDDQRHVPPASAETSMEGLSDGELQKLLAAAVKEYARRSEDREVRIFERGTDVTATDVMRSATAMLQAVELQLFELGMWQAWTGKH